MSFRNFLSITAFVYTSPTWGKMYLNFLGNMAKIENNEKKGIIYRNNIKINNTNYTAFEQLLLKSNSWDMKVPSLSPDFNCDILFSIIMATPFAIIDIINNNNNNNNN